MPDLTTLSALKLWLPIPSGTISDDGLLTRLITATSDDFERAINRPDILLNTYIEVRQGDGSPRMITYHWPIIAVTALKVGSATVLQSSDKIQPGYFWDADIDPERCWNLYLNGSTFTDQSLVSFAYQAGYCGPGITPSAGQIALPEDIEQAVIDWCAYRYRGRPNVGILRRRSSEGETAELEQVDAPPSVLSVIKRYKRELPSVDRRAEERADRLARSKK